MPTLLDQFGKPIDRSVLSEPQTSRLSTLQNQYLTPMLAGLTPAKLSSILRAADEGDLTAQHRLFSDMEERDPHLLSEMNKRKLALLGLDWDVVPPRNATAAEKKLAEYAKEVLTDAADPFEDLIIALMDGVGHGFSAVELEWRQEGGERLPSWLPRPQEWFRLSTDRRELRLLDSSVDGMPLLSFGWALHTHGKAKTGYAGRMGLHRTLVWPFLYKSYALGDFAEFLETYGLPIVVGKYFAGASADEKASLLRAVTALGHDARAIMPADMQLEIQKITGGSDGTPHMTMIDWADRAQSKAILGQTLSAEASATGLGSGTADLHGDVRDDIRNADARQIAGTITRDVIYPLLVLNRGGVDSLSRCPRLVFDTGDAEDIVAYADALPKLVQAGMRTIPVAWVHEKLRIPEPAADEAVLGAPVAPGKETPGATAALAALSAKPAQPAASTDPLIQAQTTLDDAINADQGQMLVSALQKMLAPVLDALNSGMAPDEIIGKMAEWYPQMDDTELTETLARAMFVADTWGRLMANSSAQAE